MVGYLNVSNVKIGAPGSGKNIGSFPARNEYYGIVVISDEFRITM